MSDMEKINGPDLCPICKLGKKHNTITCKSIMLHAGKWMCE